MAKEDTIELEGKVIEVIPGDPYPPYSILSQEINTGEYAQYYNQNKIELDTTKALVLNMTLYDKYKNYVNMLPAAAKVLNPIIALLSSSSFDIRKAFAPDFSWVINTNFAFL